MFIHNQNSHFQVSENHKFYKILQYNLYDRNSNVIILMGKA